MKVQILYGFRGRETKEVYLPRGEHELDDKLALYLISVGHATTLDQIVVMPDLDKTVSQAEQNLLDSVDKLILDTLDSNLNELRELYKQKTGKKAYHAWDFDTLRAKIAAWDSDHA